MTNDAIDPEFEFRNSLGRRLKAVRLEKGYTLVQVAEAMQVSRPADFRDASSLSHYENGRRPVPTFVLGWLANFYDVPLYELWPVPDEAQRALQEKSEQIDRLRAELLEAKALLDLTMKWMTLAKEANPGLLQLDRDVLEQEDQTWDDPQEYTG